MAALQIDVPALVTVSTVNAADHADVPVAAHREHHQWCGALRLLQRMVHGSRPPHLPEDAFALAVATVPVPFPLEEARDSDEAVSTGSTVGDDDWLYLH